MRKLNFQFPAAISLAMVETLTVIPHPSRAILVNLLSRPKTRIFFSIAKRERNFYRMNAGMQKGEDYAILKDAGLPVPIYGVFDNSCLTDKKAELRDCVERILNEGSGLAGVRTEAIGNPSPLGNYPHYMPLHNFDEVISAIKRNERENPQNRWWYLVNEAFLNYAWNAVVKLTREGSLPGHWTLEGEVNLSDNVPLRPALDNMENVIRARRWAGTDAAGVRKKIMQSGIVETFLEISKVKTPQGSRLIFWGRRGLRERMH